MNSSSDSALQPPGRKLLVLFHESQILGAGVSVVRAVDALRSRGWDVSAWFPSPGPLVEEVSARGVTARTHKRKPIAFSAAGWRREPGVITRLRETPGYVRGLSNVLRAVRPDVVHANSLLSLPDATLARALGFPVVLQLHELPAPGRKLRFALQWAAHVANVLVGVSAAATELLGRWAGATEVVTVRNGVPLTELARQPVGDFTVGTIGYVSRIKGTDVFLEAAKLALAARPALCFEHIGPADLWGDKAFDDHIERVARAPDLRDAVKMLGWRPRAEGLSRWNLFVLPSRQEAFPLATLEAMSASLPVIATTVGGVPEQISHLESGILVPPEQPAAIADWVVRLYDDPDLRARLAQAARARVSAHFTIEAQAEGLHRAYLAALGKRRRR